jgi:ABC-type transport system involved in cytochrome bd biosynthesis fused ATPase/permease subunit
VRGKEYIKLSPFWYAVGMFIVIPFAAILMSVAAILLLIFWPIIPLFSYFERKQDKNFNE